MEEAMGEEGQKEDRQEEGEQNLLGDALEAFGVHRDMTESKSEI
jgi:hypothetical protein